MQQVVAKSDQSTAEDFEIALGLLGKYQKDKNFIRKEDEEFKRKRDLFSADLLK